MKNSKEKGITMVALVVTIVLLLMLVSIGVNSGIPTLNSAKFTQFKNELKILQTKVNELNENGEIEIGNAELTEEQKNIITTNISNADDTIISGFRYCNRTYIQSNLGLESVNRDYLINVEYRYVISVEGCEYNGKKYFMINQLPGGVYNVDYNDKNPTTGDFDFDVNYTKEGNRWKIEVSNVKYSGYISNWKIKYRASDDEYWKTVNGLSFYVNEEGNYYVQVVHDDINLGSKLVSILEDTNEIEEIQNTI